MPSWCDLDSRSRLCDKTQQPRGGLSPKLSRKPHADATRLLWSGQSVGLIDGSGRKQSVALQSLPKRSPLSVTQRGHGEPQLA